MDILEPLEICKYEYCGNTYLKIYVCFLAEMYELCMYACLQANLLVDKHSSLKL